MAIIKQGILGGFKKKIGSVVGSSWKGVATMRSLPLSVANPKTAAQVENRNRFKACAQFASLILASFIKPLMDRFAGQMSGYNFFTKLNKEVWADPASPTWADLLISKGKMVEVYLTTKTFSAGQIRTQWSSAAPDRYSLPTDKAYLLVVNETTGDIIGQSAGEKTRTEAGVNITPTVTPTSGDTLAVYVSFLRADGSEVSNSSYQTISIA